MNKSIIDNLKNIYEKEELLGKIALKSEYKNYGISEIHCVSFIGKIEEPNVTKISKHMNMTKGAISKIIKKLINNNLILNYKNPNNDKEIYFKLTESGKTLYSYHEMKHKEWEERNEVFFKDMNIEEQKTVDNFLKKFNAYLDEVIKQKEEK